MCFVPAISTRRLIRLSDSIDILPSSERCEIQWIVSSSLFSDSRREMSYFTASVAVSRCKWSKQQEERRFFKARVDQ
jgi:hypothetical protein